MAVSPTNGSGRRRTAKVVTLLVLAALLTSCGATPARGTTSQAGSPSSTAFVSRTIPETAPGTQLRWFLAAAGNAPIASPEVDTHFDATFLAQVSPAKLNSVLAEFGTPARTALIGIVEQRPSTLVAVAAFGSLQDKVTLSVDSRGRIDGLLLTPHIPPSPTSWAQIDRQLERLAPDVSFLAARVSPDGTCGVVHDEAAATARPLGSQFKLFVLGALAQQVADGQVSWSQDLTVTGAGRSLGTLPGSLALSPAGTAVSVQDAAAKMISISDNTAADMLIGLVGRPAVQSQVQAWSSHAALDVPFLTTRELFLLHYVDYPTLANQFLRLAPAPRAAFLSTFVDPLSLSQLQATSQPRDVNTIEWFASPADVCRAFAGLKTLSTQASLSPLKSILSINDGGIGLAPSRWPTVWFKGGSEPGVLTLGYLAKDTQGRTSVVVAMAENQTNPLAPSATTTLLSIVKGAFGLLG